MHISAQKQDTCSLMQLRVEGLLGALHMCACVLACMCACVCVWYIQVKELGCHIHDYQRRERCALPKRT